MRLSLFPADSEEDSGGGGDRVVSPVPTLRAYSSPIRGHILLVAVRRRSLARIGQIVREERDRSCAIQILVPTFQSDDLWMESGGYEIYGKEMLRIEDRDERQVAQRR